LAVGYDARISVIDRYMSRDEKNCLIATCDAYVSLHRSEGFGYTLAEAMALGRPVIATDWSGNTDFMTPSNSYPVGYRLRELGQDYGPYASDQLWADPDLDEAARAMREVYEQPQQARRKGERGREEVSARFSASAVARIIGRRIELIESRLPAKRKRWGRR
jgi:glycosyltransferase involved in cell wall biosynthesis